MDSAVTAQKSKAAIRASLEAFRADPGYALDFYADKFLSQWTDGSYFCRQATQNHTNGRIRIVKSLYEGELSPAFNHFCNVYQLLVYGGALICLAGMRRREKNIPPCCPMWAWWQCWEDSCSTWYGRPTPAISSPISCFCCPMRPGDWEWPGKPSVPAKIPAYCHSPANML